MFSTVHRTRFANQHLSLLTPQLRPGEGTWPGSSSTDENLEFMKRGESGFSNFTPKALMCCDSGLQLRFKLAAFVVVVRMATPPWKMPMPHGTTGSPPGVLVPRHLKYQCPPALRSSQMSRPTGLSIKANSLAFI
jgi:hypothetical protein